MIEFEFDKLKPEEVEEYAKTSSIFNYTKNRIDKERVALVSFEDEKLGYSMEKLDLAVSNDLEKWEILDIEDKTEGFNEFPLGYLTDGVEYTYLLVIRRSMSNMVLDKVKSHATSYIYCVVDDSLRGIEDIGPVQGLLAKNRICLTGSMDIWVERLSILDEESRESVEREIIRIYRENRENGK